MSASTPAPAGAITFWLNDRRVEVAGLPGTTTLLRWLRDHQQQTGTKEGCGEGDCGACTVALLEVGADGVGRWRAVNSCILFLPMLQGRRVVTVEALREAGWDAAAKPESYHPVQVAMVAERASQCGYCTPGIVMSLFEACYRDDMGADWQVDDQVCGNLCRCTGYRPIRAAGASIAGLQPTDRFSAEARQARAWPAALDVVGAAPVVGAQRYLQPGSLDELVAARREHPSAPLVAGGTDIGLMVTKRHQYWPVVIGLEALTELVGVQEDASGWTVGARTTLTQLMDTAGAQIPALHELLRWFGSRQIRNRATLGGNLMTASPIGDMAPAMIALDATATLYGPSGHRTIPMRALLSGYRTTDAGPDEVLTSVFIPRPGADTLVRAYKVSKRREMDISTVSGAFFLRLDDGVVTEARLAFGGMAAQPGARASKAEAALVGSRWSYEQAIAASELLAQDFTPIDDFRGSAQYRALVARKLLQRFAYETPIEAAVASINDAPMENGS